MRWIALAIIIGILVILYLQNSMPVIALKFLGMETLAFPLAIWVVGAVVVGILAGWLLSGLFQIVLWLTQRQLKSKVQDLQYEVARLEAANGENWIDENDLDDRAPEPSYETIPRDFEKPQTPSPNLQEGSRYSYSYRDRPSFVPPEPLRSDDLEQEEQPQPTAKKTVDAEYRVLVPPPPESGVTPEEPDEENDWDLDDDRSNDWDDQPRSSRRGWS